MSYRVQALSLAVLACFLGEGAAIASMGMNTLPKLADQYQCTKAKNSDQTVDVLLNGSSQRFQGVARTHKGKLVEVAGVIGDYYPSAVLPGGSAAQPIAAKTDEEWQGFMIEMQMMNQLIMERMKDKFPQGSGGMMPGYGGFGGGMMGMTGGFGVPGSSESNADIKDAQKDLKEKNQTDSNAGGGPWGQIGSGMAYFGGGLFGIGYVGGELISDQERAQIRQEAAQLAEAQRLRKAQRLEKKRQQAEYDKIFAPPPPPPAPSAPPRAGDQLPPRPGDVIAQSQRPGDLAAKVLRPGDAVMAQARPGDKAVEQIRPGDAAFYGKPRPGDVAALTPRPGDMVPQAAGAVIGTANSLTFTAHLDPATGKIVQILYREEQKPSQAIRVLANPKSNDPLQGRVMEYVRRVQGLASCCEQDAKPGCDQRYNPESQQALEAFRQETEAAIGDLDGGGAIFNPFAGAAVRPGTYGPARPASRPASRQPTTR